MAAEREEKWPVSAYVFTVSGLIVANLVAHAVWISALVGWWMR